MRFRAVVELGGKTATGVEVPAEIVDALGAGRRPAVQVSLAGYRYRSTVAVMGGRFMLPISTEHRAAAGVAAGDEVDVELVVDDVPRETPLPADLAAALDGSSRAFFDGLAASQRKEWVRWVEESKKPETRAAAVQRAALRLGTGEKTR